MNPLLVQDIGFLQDTEQYQRILNSSYNPPPSLDKYVKAYIAALVKPTSLQNTLQEIISTEVFRSG